MEWAKVNRRYRIDQVVQATLTKIDHFGVHSVIEEGVRGYTKRTEALLTLRVVDLSRYFNIGDRITAKILGFSDKHQTVELSIKQAQPNPWPQYVKKVKIGDFIDGEVVLITESKAIVEVEPGIAGVLYKHELWMPCEKIDDVLMIEDRVRLQIIDIDADNCLLVLSAYGLFEGEESHEGQATFRIEEQLSDAFQIRRWETTRQKRRKYTLSAQFRAQIKQVHVIDSGPSLSSPLIQLIEGIGVRTRHATAYEFTQVKAPPFSLLLFIAGKAADDLPLLQNILKANPQTPLLICGMPEVLAELQSLRTVAPRSVHYLKIPHEFEELIAALNHCAADDEPVAAVDIPDHRTVPAATPSAPPHSVAIDSLLEQIRTLTCASSVFIFQMNLNTMETDILAAVGREITLNAFDKAHLQFSPISDVIIDGDYAHQERGIHHFKYMKPLGNFESLVGIRIHFTDEFGYGLFFLGEAPYQFAHLKRNQVEFCEPAVRACIQEAKYAQRACEEQKFILAGKLSSQFMHEMKNQMQAMDYWLEVLKTDSIRLNNDTIRNEDKGFKARFESALNGALFAEKKALSIENLFLNLFRKGEKRTVRLDQYLADFVETIRPLAALQKIRVLIDCTGRIQVAVNLAALNQILLNLLLNSLDFIPLVR